MSISEQTARQIIGATKWRNNKGIGGWEWHTGVGKTTAALQLALIPFLRKHPTGKVLVLVHNPNMKKDWKDSLKQFNLTDQVDLFTHREIINESASINKPLNYDLVIIDEPMSMMGDEDKKAWNGTSVISKFWLWLDASMDRSNPTVREFLKLFPVVDSIGEKEAIAKGFIAKSIIINYGISLPMEDREEYDEISIEIEGLRRGFGVDGLKAATWCLQGKKVLKPNGDFVTIDSSSMVMSVAKSLGYTSDIVKRINEETDEFKRQELMRIQIECNPQRLINNAQRLMELTRKRVFMLYKHPDKIKVATNILKLLRLKSIVFSESRDFIRELTLQLNLSNINTVCCYSEREQLPMGKGLFGLSFFPTDDKLILVKTGKDKGKIKKFGDVSLNKAAKSDFTYGAAEVMVSGRSLAKGLSINSIRLTMICSGSTNSDNFQQKKGRSQRNDVDDPDKVAVTLCIYFTDTVDAYWLGRYQAKSEGKIPIYNMVSAFHSIEQLKTLIDGKANNDGVNQTTVSIFS